ncbi:transposase family protein [Streptomyces sp. NPDC005251]|uniref:transposase family protein n=1 Tax=Streptomyces sp. NPDC005251 TaxID=3157166 RepID=UPI0033B82B49
MPDPRDPRGVRHALVGILALAACAVLAGATSLLAVGEWIADAPPQVLERIGVRLDPCSPGGPYLRKRRFDDCWPGSTATRWTWRSAAGSPTAATRPRAGCAAWRSTARAFAERPGPTAARSTCSQPWTTPPAWSWPSWTCRKRRTK